MGVQKEVNELIPAGAANPLSDSVRRGGSDAKALPEAPKAATCL